MLPGSLLRQMLEKLSVIFLDPSGKRTHSYPKLCHVPVRVLSASRELSPLVFLATEGSVSRNSFPDWAEDSRCTQKTMGIWSAMERERWLISCLAVLQAVQDLSHTPPLRKVHWYNEKTVISSIGCHFSGVFGAAKVALYVALVWSFQ